MRLAIWPVGPAWALAEALADVVSVTLEVEPNAARAALDEGRADVALVPTLDVFRAHEGLEVVPGVGLAGEASPRRTLVVGAQLDAIESIAFDPRDQQEAILTQLVLREHYGTQATFALAAPGEPLADVLARASAALVDPADQRPEGTFALDPGREWTDLTLRPYPWGLLAAPEGTVTPEDVARIQAAVTAYTEAEPPEALRVDGVVAYQLTLDGYAMDGLDQAAEYFFETGTLTEVPPVPFVQIPEPDDADG